MAVRTPRHPAGLPPALPATSAPTPATGPAGGWTSRPGSPPTPDARVTLAYPAAWNPDAAQQKHIDEVIRRHLGGDLACSFGPYQATWTHPPAPAGLARFDGYDLPAHKIHLATLAGGRKWVADLQDEEPHLFIAAGTGGGKTATASIPAAHVRANGWLVDIIDPKRRSYISRKTGHDVLINVPGIRVHTDIESMMWALEEFFLSMLGVNIAVGAQHRAGPARSRNGCWSSMSSARSRRWPSGCTSRGHGHGPAAGAGSAAADRMAGPPGRAPAGRGRPPAQPAAGSGTPTAGASTATG